MRKRTIALILASSAPAAGVAAKPYQLAPSASAAARELRFGTGLSRVTYRSKIHTEDSFRPRGAPEAKKAVTESDRRFQVSVWQIPNGSGILRVQTTPLRTRATSGDLGFEIDTRDSPHRVQYKTPLGLPCTYWGKELSSRNSSTLVFPARAVKPGDSWTRVVPASDEFQLPTEVLFTYLAEGRVNNRLCAEIQATATAKGRLPEKGGTMTLKIEATFLFDIRLGRVLFTRSQLYQWMVGRKQGDETPPKRVIEESVETLADI